MGAEGGEPFEDRGSEWGARAWGGGTGGVERDVGGERVDELVLRREGGGHGREGLARELGLAV